MATIYVKEWTASDGREYYGMSFLLELTGSEVPPYPITPDELDKWLNEHGKHIRTDNLPNPELYYAVLRGITFTGDAAEITPEEGKTYVEFGFLQLIPTAQKKFFLRKVHATPEFDAWFRRYKLWWFLRYRVRELLRFWEWMPSPPQT